MSPKQILVSPFTIQVHHGGGTQTDIHNLTNALLSHAVDPSSSRNEKDDEYQDSTTSTTITSSMSSLRFKFSGFSIWLDLMDYYSYTNPNNMDHYHNQDNDLEHMHQAISYAASLYNVQPIPQPHVTLLYGVEEWTESEARDRFQKLARWIQTNSSSSSHVWPPLQTKGILVDKEIFGQNNATMSMAWMEISYKTSVEQERLVDAAYEIFHPHGIAGRRGQSWSPHLSLCYDNPEDSQFHLMGAFHIVSRFPSLLNSKIPRGISLWNTAGTMEEWICMDRFSFSLEHVIQK